MAVADKPEPYLHTAAEWQQWLETSPTAEGVRLKLRKVSSTQPGFTYAEALDVALCFGWIDGQALSLDDDFFLRVFTPRRRNSPWSKINRGHVDRLIAAGRMRPGGQAEVDRAKADGRWDAAYRVSDDEVPADLQAALDASPAAAAMFAGLTKQNRFAIVYRLGAAKRAETRERKVLEFVAMLERGETFHPR